MKSTITLLILLGLSQISQAQETQIDVLSWCEDNKVIAINPAGETQIKADCSEDNLVCTSLELHKWNTQVFTANCQTEK